LNNKTKQPSSKNWNSIQQTRITPSTQSASKTTLGKIQTQSNRTSKRGATGQQKQAKNKT
jgi:hypothetical protein